MRASVRLFAAILALAPISCFSAENPAVTGSRVQLQLDASEAEQALVILHKEQARDAVEEADWKKMFSTLPYQWLKAREAGMGNAFTDEDFRKFLEMPETQARTAEWEQSLAGMEHANMTALGERVLDWLPAGALIQARVFPMIKPRTNSFVWRNAEGEPAIFIYLDKQTKAQFETIVAHECHHIGLFSLSAQQAKILDGLPENVKTAAELTGAFGEGEAVLAAAGSTEMRPHWEDDALDRARWDSHMMHFNQDLATLTQFFEDVLDEKLKGEALDEKAFSFLGYQGPWYTVGYEMAALVERRFGRKVFTDCLLDSRLLLVRYNTEANKNGASLALWPDRLIERIYTGRLPEKASAQFCCPTEATLLPLTPPSR